MNTGQIILIIVIAAGLIGIGVWYNNAGKTRDDSFYNLQIDPSLNNINQNSMNPLAEENIEYGENAVVVLQTNRGDIEIELFLTEAPVTAGNFLTLAESGFYDDVKFHRVIKGFMIQGGDPNTKEDNEMLYGMGGPGYNIPDEFAPGLKNETGTISMANAGPNTGGSQFFINTADNVHLDGRHAVFGRVVGGMEIVRAIEDTPTKERDIPSEPVIIQGTEIKPLQ